MLKVFIYDNAADPGLTNQGAYPPDPAGNLRCQAFGGFVEDQHFGVGYKRAADRQHLLFTAAELLPPVIQAFFQSWKGVEHAVIWSVALAACSCTRCHF